MSKPKTFTIATPRYTIEGVNGEYFDVFNKRQSAIKAAIKLATEYPGTTFQVVKKVFHKRKVIFSYSIKIDMQFEDLKIVYLNMIAVYQEKLDKIKYWRKIDDPGT